MITLLAAGYIAACFKWGVWRRWRDFYNTVLYVIIGDLAYQFVFNDYRLWTYPGVLGHTYTALIITFIIFPPAIILYLTHFPSGFLKQVLYIIIWAVVNTLIELAACIMNGLRYEHGWTLYWSFILFFIAFILIRAHHLRPLLVWPVSLACGVVCALIFGLPPLVELKRCETLLS